MDGNRFDNLARAFARRFSRRAALKGTATLGATAVASTSALAQSGPTICRLALQARTAAGPATGVTIEGEIAFTVNGSGAIADGTFAPVAGPPAQVGGQALGRAIDLQIVGTDGRTLALSGLGQEPISECSGLIGGLFSGLEPGDLGAWQARADEQEGRQGGGGSAGAATATATPSPSATPEQCPPLSQPCGPNCCPDGAPCLDPEIGLCECPPGTEQCQNECVPSCPGNQQLDLETCACSSTCTPEGQSCAQHSDCCTGYCGGGTCFTCAGRVCGEYGCIDPMRDNLHCGGCNRACVAPQVCVQGSCQSDDCTIQGGTRCGSECVFNLMSNNDHCGACFNKCTIGYCQNGLCCGVQGDCAPPCTPTSCGPCERCVNGYCEYDCNVDPARCCSSASPECGMASTCQPNGRCSEPVFDCRTALSPHFCCSSRAPDPQCFPEGICRNDGTCDYRVFCSDACCRAFRGPNGYCNTSSNNCELCIELGFFCSGGRRCCAGLTCVEGFCVPTAL